MGLLLFPGHPVSLVVTCDVVVNYYVFLFSGCVLYWLATQTRLGPTTPFLWEESTVIGRCVVVDSTRLDIRCFSSRAAEFQPKSDGVAMPLLACAVID